MVRTKYRRRSTQVGLATLVVTVITDTVIRTLGNSFGLSGLAVATAVDSIVYKSDVLAASNLPSGAWDQAASSSTPSRPATSGRSGMAAQKQVWGDKAVLILIGIRLGLDGVNPIYYDSVKVSQVYIVEIPS